MAKRSNTFDKQIQAQLTKEVKRANALLQRLQGHYGTKETYASKKLYKTLSQKQLIGTVITEKGYIKFNKNLSESQARYILKAAQKFNTSKTSTVKGIELQKEATKRSIKAMLSSDEVFGQDMAEDIANKFTDEDIENFYSVFTDSEAMRWIEDKGYSPSEFLQMCNTAIKENWSIQTFFERFNVIETENTDYDEVEVAKRIYYKYIAHYSR